MYTHILFPSDFSVSSELAFERALELAVLAKAKLTLLHVIDLPAHQLLENYGLLEVSGLQTLEVELEAKATTLLEHYAGQLAAAGVDYDLLIRPGHAGEQIVATAENRLCDLIVIGSRGFGPLRATLLGSTSNYVLHHSLSPVLVIPLSLQDD